MEVIIENRIFKRHQDVWMAPLTSEDPERTFEVYHENINTSLVKDILSKIDDGSIQHIYNDAVPCLKKLSSDFWKKDMSPEFILSGVTIGLNGGNSNSDFSLFYHMNSKINAFSDYANWLVDVRDFKITECRREQL